MRISILMAAIVCRTMIINPKRHLLYVDVPKKDRHTSIFKSKMRNQCSLKRGLTRISEIGFLFGLRYLTKGASFDESGDPLIDMIFRVDNVYDAAKRLLLVRFMALLHYW